jgi:hypothetical protein
MPANKSSNKVRVTRLFGGGATAGYADPKPNMKVKHHAQDRWIVGLDSGNFQVSLSLSSGGAVMAKAYPHALTVPTGTAIYFGWPTAPGSVTLGHSGVFPNGVALAVGSGMEYMGGNGQVTYFSRG